MTHKQRTDFKFGRHSGIPTCCVKAFVRGDAVTSDEMRATLSRTRYNQILYRPCRRCFTLYKAGLIEPSVLYFCDLEDWLSVLAWLGPLPMRYARPHKCGLHDPQIGSSRWAFEHAESPFPSPHPSIHARAQRL